MMGSVVGGVMWWVVRCDGWCGVMGGVGGGVLR